MANVIFPIPTGPNILEIYGNVIIGNNKLKNIFIPFVIKFFLYYSSIFSKKEIFLSFFLFLF